MAFNTAQFSLTWADSQGRTNVVKLYPDGYSAGTTAISSTDTPCVYRFGSPGDDPFRPLVPTDLEIHAWVSDSTVYDAIKGDAEGSWKVEWTISGTEVWRGYLIPDEIMQPVDGAGELVLRAACGLLFLEDQPFTPSSDSRQTMMVLTADALSNLSGVDYQIAAAANWHSSGGSGNSFAEYEVTPLAMKEEEKDLINQDKLYAPAATYLSQIAGRFAAKIFQARGKWRLVQRESVTGSSYAQDIYDTSGSDTATNDTVSRLEINTATAPLLLGAAYRPERQYEAVEVLYSHGPIGLSMFRNRSFENWSGGLPTYWDEWDEDPGTVPNTGSIVSQKTFTSITGSRGGRLSNTRKNSAALVAPIDNGGIDNTVAKALIGIKQDAAGEVTDQQGCILRLNYKLDVGAIGSESIGHRPFYIGLWLEAGATDYYWDIGARAWTSGTFASPEDASKMEFFAPYAGADWQGVTIDTSQGGTITFPASGTLRVILYNVVEIDSSANISGILYDDVEVEIIDDTTTQDGTRIAREDAGKGKGTFEAGTFFFGQGPTSIHKGKITRDGGTYASSWSSSGGAEAAILGDLHAQRIWKAKNNGAERLIATFRLDSGTYWPDQPLLFDSDEYTCVYLEHDANSNTYIGEWVTTGVTSDTPTSDPGSSPAYLLPTDIYDLLWVHTGVWEVPDKGDGLRPSTTENTLSAAYTKLGVGTATADTFLVNLRNDGTIGDGEVGVRMDSGVGGGATWLWGIDTTNDRSYATDNSFVLTEGATLGVSPAAGVGDRLIIDADGNWFINPEFYDTSYDFRFWDSKATLLLDSAVTTGLGQYGDTAGITFKSHYWTGSADSSNSATIGLTRSADSDGAATFQILHNSAEIGIATDSDVNLLTTGAVNIWQRAWLPATDYDSPVLKISGAYSASARHAHLQYVQDGASDAFDLALTAYTDAGSTAGETFKVKNAGGVSWGGMDFPSADGTANYVLTTDGAGAVTWQAVGSGTSTALNDLTDVTITAAAQGELLVHNGTAWVDFAVGTSGQFLKTQGAGADPAWTSLALSDISDAGTAAANATEDFLSATGADTAAGAIKFSTNISFAEAGGAPTFDANFHGIYATSAGLWTREASGTSYQILNSGNDTDDLSEGSTNLYYTDARVDTRLDTAQTIGAAWKFDAAISFTESGGAPTFSTNYHGIYATSAGLWTREGSGTSYAIINEGSSSYNNADWDTAFGWGDHDSVGYATLSGTETFTGAKTFDASATFEAGIKLDEESLDLAGAAGYLSVWSLTTGGLFFRNGTGTVYRAATTADIANSSDWDTAFGWGDHSGQGYLTTVALNDVSDVTITSVGNGEVLWYSTGWKNGTLAEAGIAASSHTHTASEITDLATAATGITKVGTIATGTWQGTAIASAYLDADTAHLSGTQTFSGAKTFSAAATFSSTLTHTGNLTAASDSSTSLGQLAVRYINVFSDNVETTTINSVASGAVTASGSWDFSSAIKAPGLNHDSGELLIENTAAAANLTFKVNSTAAAQTLMYWKFDTVARMELNSDGDLQIDGTLTESSDRRLKSNIAPLLNSTSILRDINPVTYYKDGRMTAGLIAQEVAEVWPLPVYQNSSGYLGLSYTTFVPLLVASLKDAHARIDELETLLSR